MRLEQTPEVLTQKSREIIARLGYEGRPADSAFGLAMTTTSRTTWRKTTSRRTGMRCSPRGRPCCNTGTGKVPMALVASDFRDNLLTPGIVTRNDPPTVLSGMINLELDPQGRLTYFQAIPPQKQDEKKETCAGAGPRAFDWNILFAAAGLDPSKLQPAQPIWTSLAASDTRMAWTGSWPGRRVRCAWKRRRFKASQFSFLSSATGPSPNA